MHAHATAEFGAGRHGSTVGSQQNIGIGQCLINMLLHMIYYDHMLVCSVIT